MAYRFTADLVTILHLLFIVLVVLGGLLVLRWPRLAWVHVPIVIWGFLIEVMGWICPLTPLEQKLRLAAGERGYEGSFIDHYIVPLMYPQGLTYSMRMVLAGIIAVLNISIYLWLIRKRLARKFPE